MEIQQYLFKMPPIGRKEEKTNDIKLNNSSKVLPQPKANPKPKRIPKGPIIAKQKVEQIQPQANDTEKTIKV